MGVTAQGTHICQVWPVHDQHQIAVDDVDMLIKAAQVLGLELQASNIGC